MNTEVPILDLESMRKELLNNPVEDETPTLDLKSIRGTEGAATPTLDVESLRNGSIQPSTPTSAAPKTPQYSLSDLPSFIGEIREYGRAMVGDNWDHLSDDEVIERYKNRMRGFAAGNSVRATRELARLSQLDDEQLATVGAGYQVWNEMEGLFSEDNTWSETGEGLLDYTRTIIADPANLIGLGVGKAFASGGTKAAVRIAQESAKKAYVKALAGKAASAATRKAAVEAGEKVFTESAVAAAKSQATGLLKRQAIRDATNKTAKKMATREAYRELGATMAFDAALSAGTELAYQKGMIMTGQQEDINRFGLGLAALGVLGVGGLSAGSIALKGSSGLRAIDPFVDDPKAAGRAVTKLTDTLTKNLEAGDWFEKVAKGKELKDLDQNFWTTLLLGDEKEGIKGMAAIFVEEGFQWQRLHKDDKISNFIADVLKTADKADAEDFIKLMEKTTGNKMTDLSGQVADGGMDAFANSFAKKISDAGVLMNAASQLAKQQGRDALTPEEIGKLKLEDLVPSNLLGPNFAGDELSPSWFNKVSTKGLERFQNNTIRMLVSSVSTTALNVKGWGMASAMNTMSDLTLATLHGGKAGAKYLKVLATRDLDKKKVGMNGVVASLRESNALAGSTLQKFRNLLDPNTTIDTFQSIALARPESMRAMTNVLPGGIEDLSKLARDQGFDPDMTVGGATQEKFVEAMQHMALVTYQDVFTKSQEFLAQLDKGVRINMGITLRDMLDDPLKARKLMATEQYAKAEGKALYETQRAIYSKSYAANTGVIGPVAKVIEEARNIPFIGIMVPFGRFFNNVLAQMADASGVTLGARMILGKGAVPDRSLEEIATRTALSWGAIWALSNDEFDLRDRGFSWSEREDPNTGEVLDERYNFPYSFYKAAARLTTYYRDASDLPPQEELDDMNFVFQKASEIISAFRNEKEIPGELVSMMGKDVVGQLTRQLSESSEGILELIKNTISGEAEVEDWVAMAGKSGAQMASSWTRWLEPFDMAVGLANEVDFTQMDRKQGSEFINKVSRYTSNLTALGTGNTEMEKRYSMASGTPSADPTKFVGMRTGGLLTPAEKVANVLGIPTWKLDALAADPKADNRINQLGNSFLNREAKKLWDSEEFQAADLERKNKMFATVKQKTMAFVKEWMKKKVGESDDPYLLLSYKLSETHSKKDIERGIKLIGEGATEMSELNWSQLELLRGYLENREDWLK